MASFITAHFLRRLSVAQREELVNHVAGAQPFTVGPRGDGARMFCVRKLIELGLIKGDHRERPRFTHITDAGREAAAAILGEYADALVQAGCLEARLRPIDLVELIKQDGERRRLEAPRVGPDHEVQYRAIRDQN